MTKMSFTGTGRNTAICLCDTYANHGKHSREIIGINADALMLLSYAQTGDALFVGLDRPTFRLSLRHYHIAGYRHSFTSQELRSLG